MKNLVRFAERLFLVTLSVAVIIRVAPAIPSRPHVALFLFTEIVSVVLILAQRRGEWTTKAYPIAIAFFGTAAGLMITPNGTRLLPELASTALVFFGAAIALFAKLSLGRSFGVVPANRSIKYAGAYQFVRHPMYFGYFVNHLGFLVLYFSAWNVTVYAIAWTLLWLRILEEEKFLAGDQDYQRYSEAVRYRLIPGVI